MEGRTLEELFAGRDYDIDASYQRMKALMDAEGLPYSRRTHTYNSRPAQEIGKWAAAEHPDQAEAVDNGFYHAYFVDGRARPGKPEYERRWAGAAWRFVNSGNMEAFFDAPSVYAPRYGGYGALSIARGLSTQGKPVFFELRDGMLYFFYSPANRHIWRSAPATYVEQADRKWETMRKKLVR